METLDLIIIGAGPSSLTLSCSLLFDNPNFRNRFRVYDANGWMGGFKDQFEAQNIQFLRSPFMYHPHRVSQSFRDYAVASKAEGEVIPPDDTFVDFYVKSGRMTLGGFKDAFSRPSTQLFLDFCKECVYRYRLEEVLFDNRIQRIEPFDDGRSFVVHLEGGKPVKAKRVVLAIGSSFVNMPPWSLPFLKNNDDRLVHSKDVFLPGLDLKDERVLIIGGGLSAGHLSVGAVQCGASNVTLCTRGPLKSKQFDIAPMKLLKDGRHILGKWHDCPLNYRMDRIIEAKEGGSITPEILEVIYEYQRQSKIQLRQSQTVESLQENGKGWRVKFSDGSEEKFDRIWCCTGFKLDVSNEPLVREIAEKFPIEIHRGLPDLDPYCQWGETNFHILGRYAAFALGPEAFNMGGGILAAKRLNDLIINSTANLPEDTSTKKSITETNIFREMGRRRGYCNTSERGVGRI